jgi:ABC-type sugar transport system ATPase subunit
MIEDGQKALIEVEDVSKSFGTVQAVVDISLLVYAGEGVAR